MPLAQIDVNKIEFEKKPLKYGFNFWQGIDWSNDALHPLKIISVILRCWWRALQYWRYFDKVVTHFKLHDVLHSLIDKICSSLILRCHHMLIFSFWFRPIKQQWSFNVCQGCIFQDLDKRDLNIHLSVFACQKILWELGEHCHNN